MSRVGIHQNDFFFLTFLAFSDLFWLGKNLWCCFQIFWIFLLFFCYFQLRVVKEHIGKTFFTFSLSHPFPTYFGLKKNAIKVFSNFLNFFAIFFGIFYYGSGRNTSERFFLLSFFLTLSQPILAWKKCYKGVFKFFKFFCVFFFNFLLRVG